MRDLGSLRELKPHQEDLLKKQAEEAKPDEDILDLMTKHKSQRYENPKKAKVGRPYKKENQFITTRITLILTEDQKKIINNRRGANTIGEIDTSSFIREWLVKTNCFNTTINPIKDYPTSNLPE
jgi:hypothetical protein